MLKNVFWDIALDLNIRAIVRKLIHLTFDYTWQLRVLAGWTVAVSSWTITQANIWYWDTGKLATGIIETRKLSYNNRRNYAK